jgi:hypothetical protein
MFEKYTEKARRTIFYGRYEASQMGSPAIASEHLLLGLLREDKPLAERFLHADDALESVRSQIAAQLAAQPADSGKPSTTADLSFTHESKRILAFAAEESLRLQHEHIGTEHLFLGILHEPESLAARLLADRGITLDQARAGIAEAARQNQPVEVQSAEAVSSRLQQAWSAMAGSAQQRPAIALTESGPNEFLFSFQGNAPIPRIGEKISIRDKAMQDQASGLRVFRVVDIEWRFDRNGEAAELNVVKLTVEQHSAESGSRGDWQAFT